jgi:hypothetical protein
MASGYARRFVSQESQHYYVLLIITDGEITGATHHSLSLEVLTGK